MPDIIINTNQPQIILPAYKVYTATISQNFTEAPVAIVRENTLGGEVVWSRTSPGTYYATLVNGFPTDEKTVVFIITNSGLSGVALSAERIDNDKILVVSANDGVDDNILGDNFFEIRVYP